MTTDWIRKLVPLAAAALFAPLPAAAQRVDVCALVACSASGQGAAVLAEPAQARPAAAQRRPAQTETTRDPWARRFQGRENEDDDVCLLNFGIGGQLARKGAVDSHLLGRTQVWRAPAQGPVQSGRLGWDACLVTGPQARDRGDVCYSMQPTRQPIRQPI